MDGRVGKAIRKRRLELGMSVDDLAKKIGKNRATVYRYENGGIESMPVTVLEPIAEALQINPAELMGYTDKPKLDETAAREDFELLTLYHALTEQQKTLVRRMMLELLANK